MFFNCAHHLLTYMTEVSKGFESLVASDIAQILDRITVVTKFKYNTINLASSCPPQRLLCDFILNTLTPCDSSKRAGTMLFCVSPADRHTHTPRS